jgi:phage FluMu protein Com
MIRKIKTLGIALVAAAALSALGASTASAVEFHSELEDTVLTSSETAAFNGKLTFDSGTVECENTTAVGAITGKTTNTARLSPTFSGCTGTFGVSVTIRVNGCEKVLTTGGAKEVLHIVCPPGKVIEITVPGCVVTIFPQTIENGISWTNHLGSFPKHITLHIKSTGLTYEEHNKGLFPTCIQPPTIKRNNGTWTASTTVFGESTSGASTSVWRE